ncbi:hypothetical protein GALMADRAFT_142216 [Galerina marginata CBS 339.88]|nr:hypothetical protein GALMADRAFT_142216 [Galerina marginata CBS 339.88]
MLKDWQTYLNNIDFVYLTESPGFDKTSNRTVTFVSNNDGKNSKNTVVVCEAKGTSCLTPIMSSRYTCQMTFFTRNHIYCMHPHFTPQLKTLQITQDVNDTHRAQTGRLIERGFVLIEPKEEVKLCAHNILCRAVVRVVGRRPHRATQRPIEMIGILSLGTAKEDFLRSKRVQFSLGGICDRYNCINQPDFDRT